MNSNITFLQRYFNLGQYENEYLLLKDSESILQETYHLTHKLDLFESVLTAHVRNKRIDFIVRLCKWFSYFNKNQFHASMIYNRMIEAVLNASIRNELISEQTQCEFETSLSFFDRFYSLQKLCWINDIKSATYLLNTSLIYGCYPGMQVGSLNKGFSVLKNEVDYLQVRACFETIFVKYKTITIWMNEFDKIEDKKSIELFLDLLRGKKLEKNNYLTNVNLTKRELHLFVNFSGASFNFENQVLTRYFAYFKLLSIDELGQHRILHLLNCSKLFQLKLFTFIEHIEYWKQAYLLFQTSTESQRMMLNLREYVDYVEFKKFYEDINYSLKGRTIDSIRHAITIWHRRGSSDSQKAMLNYKWEPLNLAEIEYHFKNGTYVFQELNTGALLAEESEKMNHCVFSYTHICAKGLSRIFSVKEKVNNKFAHLLTIQITKSKIVQAVGVNNRRVKIGERGLLEHWAKENELEVDL